MLTRLIYASEPTDALTPSAVQHIVDGARSNNTRQHLSGLLAFDSQFFLQVLEGDRAALSALFGRIAADPRHRRIELLEVTPVHERRFAHWSMGFAAADAAHGELFLRFGGSPRFEPYALTAAGALGLLEAMASVKPG
jgi:Sensors of blue-light using FAD